MKLYHYYRSSASYRVRIALNYKGIAWQTELVDLRAPASAQHQPQFRALNPLGLIPVLKDQDAVLTQSLAIIEYLEETHPQPPLLPRAALERAEVRALALTIACDTHPLQNLRVLNYLRSHFGADDAAVNRWAGEWIARSFAALEQRVARLGDGRHMFGADVTLADVCLVPMMYNAQRYQADLAPYPRLRAIDAYLRGLPAFASAAPEAQADAPR